MLLSLFTGNGIYGFCSIESTNYTNTRIMSERYLHENKAKRDLLLSENLQQLTLLGATLEPGKRPNLVYALTFKQPSSEIRNILQVSATILSSSRCVFLGKILTLLRCFDPRKLEICYTGETWRQQKNVK
jgi:hypothetical protein